MSRLLRVLLVGVIVWAFVVWAGGRAYDQEIQASVREPASRAPSVLAAEQTVGSGARLVGASPSAREPTSLTGRSSSIAAIRLVFGRRAPAAIRVAGCETGYKWNERAVGRAGERGIFQLHPIHRGWIDRLYGWNRMFEPLQNARAAYRLSRGGTRWGAWSCGWAA